MADEKVTIVDADRASGSGMVLAIVGIIAILVIAYVLLATDVLSGGTEKIDADVKIETPSK